MRYYSLYEIIRCNDNNNSNNNNNFIYIYLSCRFTSAMVVHVLDLPAIALQEVQGKMSFHVRERGVMESSGLLG